MKAIFNEETLMALAQAHAASYQSASPFPHAVFDNFMDASILNEAVAAFPSPDSFNFYKYDNPLEKKLAFDQISKLPDPISQILWAMNGPIFLNFLETLTGIDGLIPDPYYRGGGIHQILPGGKLDVHIDFNKHQKLKLDRRLNVLIYLNKDWDESYGGYFELWSGKFNKETSLHELHACQKKVLPIFNRMAIFSTSERSYHGHPDPLTCPAGMSRKSIATYYYSNGRPQEEDVDAHSTTFIKRPSDSDDQLINELRVKRNKGRLTN